MKRKRVWRKIGLFGRLLRMVALLLVTRSAGSSYGAIIATQASVTTTVQELIEGVPGSVNTDEQILGEDEAVPPLLAQSELTSTDLEDQLVSLAFGVTQYLDPTRLDQPNPEEFTLEIGGFSRGADVAYIVEGTIVEERTVVFTTAGSSLAPVEIEFRTDGTRVIESQIFLSGAAVIWGIDPAVDLAEVSTEVRVTIIQDDDLETPLFETALTVAAAGEEEFVGGAPTEEVPSSGVDIERIVLSESLVGEVVGPMVVEALALDDLAAEEELDETSPATLRDLADAGQLLILAIPNQEHVYRYTVQADASTRLTAIFSANVRNAPAGSGVALVLGRPFENLADFIAIGLGGVDSRGLERSINKALQSRETVHVDNSLAAQTTTPPGLCGAFGFESLVMLGGLMTMGLVSCRCRRVGGLSYSAIANAAAPNH